MGEISAVLEIVKRRNYIAHLQQVIAHVQQTGQPKPFFVSVTQEYFWVYKQNASRLGILKHPLPQKIATFYTQCFAILEDLKSSFTPSTAQQSLMMLQELLSLFQSTTDLGAEILKLGK